MSFEARIKELGLTIPEPPRPAGRFVPAVQVGNLIFVSGQISAVSGRLGMKGKLGRDLSIEQGQEAARQAVLATLNIRSKACVKDGATRSFSSPFVEQTGGEKVLT